MSEVTEQQSVIRVREALARLGAQGEVRALDDSARTAKEAADALGIEVGQIANSLVFMADGEPVLVMASGGHHERCICDECYGTAAAVAAIDALINPPSLPPTKGRAHKY